MPDKIARGDLLPTELLDEAAAAHQAVTEAAEKYAELLADRKAKWIAAYRGGFAFSQIADAAKVTAPWVHRVVTGGRPSKKRATSSV